MAALTGCGSVINAAGVYVLLDCLTTICQQLLQTRCGYGRLDSITTLTSELISRRGLRQAELRCKRRLF